MKKKSWKALMILLILLVILCIVSYGLYLHHKNKEAELKRIELGKMYHFQNTALEIDCTIADGYVFYNSDAIEMPELVVDLYVYNKEYPEMGVSFENVVDYLKNEYDEQGQPLIYSRPDNITNYIEWYYHNGDEKAWDEKKKLMDYLSEKNARKYWEMEYSELVKALSEYDVDSE